jgi:glycosyltransferase involved in cell wall biosynthesis
MNIVVLADRESGKSGWRRLLVETINDISNREENHQFLIIDKECWANFYSGIICVEFLPSSEGKKKLLPFFTRKYHALQAHIKKFNPDLIVSAGYQKIIHSSCPQLFFSINPEKSRPADKTVFKKILVISQWKKKHLETVYQIPAEKITVILPLTDGPIRPDHLSGKEEIKELYTEGKEFFLCNDTCTEPEFISILKSFSLFKKRQQSSMQLVFFTPADQLLSPLLENYKYRKDVKIISPDTPRIAGDITAAAYAVVLPFIEKSSWPAMQAIQSEVPVIAVKNPELEELAGEAVWFTEVNDPQGMGEKMMRLYTDEEWKRQFIQKGNSLILAMTHNKTLPPLWKCMIEAYGNFRYFCPQVNTANE